uniref:Uncharacterized protein n=1 Tax=Solanum tuberosum TaxID=4113 RepID=M1DZ25_SOLTU
MKAKEQGKDTIGQKGTKKIKISKAENRQNHSSLEDKSQSRPVMERSDWRIADLIGHARLTSPNERVHPPTLEGRLCRVNHRSPEAELGAADRARDGHKGKTELDLTPIFGTDH